MNLFSYKLSAKQNVTYSILEISKDPESGNAKLTNCSISLSTF